SFDHFRTADLGYAGREFQVAVVLAVVPLYSPLDRVVGDCHGRLLDEDLPTGANQACTLIANALKRRCELVLGFDAAGKVARDVQRDDTVPVDNPVELSQRSAEAPISGIAV